MTELLIEYYDDPINIGDFVTIKDEFPEMTVVGGHGMIFTASEFFESQGKVKVTWVGYNNYNELKEYKEVLYRALVPYYCLKKVVFIY